jgi:hypothetical protein
MLTAKEARERTQQSVVVLDKMLKRICEAIGLAADNGKSELILDYALHNDQELKIVDRWGHGTSNSNLTPFQLSIKRELEKLFYNVTVVAEQHDGKAGLGMMDDDPKPFTTYHIKVRW